MKLTEISAPDCCSEVVDCQWVCPADIPAPKCIGLVAQSNNGGPTSVTLHQVQVEYGAKNHRSLVRLGEPTPTFQCDDVLVAVGQQNASPCIERNCGIEVDKGGPSKVDYGTMASTNPKLFFGRDAAFEPKMIARIVAQGRDATLPNRKLPSGENIDTRRCPRLTSLRRR